jgi:hypothetical protein
MSSFIHLICDYAPGDLAWAEICSSLSAKLPTNAHIHITSVGSFDTIATGFTLAQLGLANNDSKPNNLLLFANCAPRKDRKDPRANNEGEGLLYLVLKNNTEAIAVNSGYSLSFVRDEIKELWSVDVKDDGSQFRSRDYFPDIVAKVVNKDYSFKLHSLSPGEIIPKIPNETIAYIDSFGNLKTTYREGDKFTDSLKSGDRIKVKINNIIRTATVATGTFNVSEGDLAFAPGSSGHKKRFWEFFQRGGSAYLEFNHPSVGSKIEIEISK